MAQEMASSESLAAKRQAPSASTDDSLDAVIRTLDSIAETRFVWKDGLFHPGGPHRRLKGEQYPISIGEDECRAFGRLVRAMRPEDCFIIGNAFGLSSAYIAHVMKGHGGKSCITLDDQSEGNGQRCAKVAQELASKMGLDGFLFNKKGRSPENTLEAAAGKKYDLIFIDGLHRHPQVTYDFDGVQPIAKPTSVFVWHDGWIPGIPESVAAAKRQGVHCLWLPTSCEIIVGSRDAGVFEKLQAAFPEGEIEHSPPSYFIGYLKYLQTYWGIRFQRAGE
ncbi:MAG TPA: class I SAM-dependent methyltransferase [Polyangiaceae bacterium]|nr:class I SAM-dependent methyltransferase [Polyangiaceae bacterium]